MKIYHYRLTPLRYRKRLLESLYNNNLFNQTGVLRKVYKNPESYIKEEAYLSIMKNNKEYVSCMFISKNIYFGWEYELDLNHTYGMISFYTKIKYRRKGYARQLFEDFDSKTKIRPISASARSKGILRSVEDKDIVYQGSGKF